MWKEHIPLPLVYRDFWKSGTIKRGFWCIIKFELTYILAGNVYDLGTKGGGGGETVSVVKTVMYWTPRG